MLWKKLKSQKGQTDNLVDTFFFIKVRFNFRAELFSKKVLIPPPDPPPNPTTSPQYEFFETQNIG